jgi:flavin-binding protein dodecin
VKRPVVGHIIGRSFGDNRLKGREQMSDGVYRVTEVIGTSTESWEAAARSAVETAAKTVRDLRIAEVIRQDLTIEDGGVSSYRVRLGISFKYESGD